VPALAATAAAVCLAPQAMVDPAPAHAAAGPAVAADAASYAGLPAEVLPAKANAAGNTAGSAQAQTVTYTVRAGDSLSSIADRFYHQQSAWPVLYWANHSKIRSANIISVGQVLKVPAKPAKIPSAPSALGSVAPAPVTAAPAASAPAYAPVQAAAATVGTYSGGTPGGSFGQCVVARESGGNAQVMNSSGHYGLYQFSESTWEAYGGSAADFGHASVAEQNQVFANALAQGGQSNWSAYDGC
jgi:LysM repeat protein